MAGKGGKPGAEPARAVLRIDKWLFLARFFRARSLAADVVSRGHCRINAQRVSKPGHGVAEGDVLTFPQGGRIRLVRVLALGTRRGPASEAQALYFDLDPPPDSPAASSVLE